MQQTKHVQRYVHLLQYAIWQIQKTNTFVIWLIILALIHFSLKQFCTYSRGSWGSVPLPLANQRTRRGAIKWTPFPNTTACVSEHTCHSLETSFLLFVVLRPKILIKFYFTIPFFFTLMHNGMFTFKQALFVIVFGNVFSLNQITNVREQLRNLIDHNSSRVVPEKLRAFRCQAFLVPLLNCSIWILCSVLGLNGLIVMIVLHTWYTFISPHSTWTCILLSKLLMFMDTLL